MRVTLIMVHFASYAFTLLENPPNFESSQVPTFSPTDRTAPFRHVVSPPPRSSKQAVFGEILRVDVVITTGCSTDAPKGICCVGRCEPFVVYTANFLCLFRFRFHLPSFQYYLEGCLSYYCTSAQSSLCRKCRLP